MTVPLEQPKRRYTISEYIQFEYDAKEPHEYRDGLILGMSGGSYEHSMIVSNVVRELGNALKGTPCRVLEGHMRVRNPRKVLYTYPDATVVCGKPQFDPVDERRHTITNPKVLVEVLSPSTEGYDRGEKFDRYREIETLEEYVLVNQSAARVETFLRQPDGTWSLAFFSGMDSVVRFRSLGIELPLREMYADVEFPPEETVPPEPEPPPTKT